MKLVIHRGAHEIGGTCIQLSDQGTTILLDLGLPLRKESKHPELGGVKPDAILISHPHQDHFGLIERFSHIPVYIGRVSKSLMEAGRLFSLQKPFPHEFRFMEAWKKFALGAFQITPFLMDHSSPEAFALLIECAGKKVFYSGDFRAHGRKKVLFENMVKKPPKSPDVLIMEGTMLRRDNNDFPTEAAVEKAILKVIKDQNKITFLISSSQNIDRIVSAYRACKRSGNILVIDLYTAWVLEQMKVVTQHVPQMDWPEVRVYIPGNQYDLVKKHPKIFGSFKAQVFHYRIQEQELLESPQCYLYLTRNSNFRQIRKFMGQGPINLIYSQWMGYLKEDNWDSFGAKQMAGFQQETGVKFVYAHTSGHAPLVDLKTFAQAINPKMLIPVHTEYPEEFKEHFENVVEMADGKEVEI